MDSRIVIDVGEDFSGKSIRLSNELWEVLKKFQGNTFTITSPKVDVDIHIKNQNQQTIKS